MEKPRKTHAYSYKIIERYSQSISKLPETPSEIIQKLTINHSNIEIKNYNAKNQLFTYTNISGNTKTSLEASPIENIDTIVSSQPTDTCINKTTETNLNSTMLDDVTLFSSHTVNTLNDIEDNG